MVSFPIAITMAILSPFVFAFVNTLDKFIISKKVKSSLGFTALAGFTTLFFGVMLGLFLDWKNVTFLGIWPVAVSGIMMGLQYFAYYKILEKSDVSNFEGLLYIYPIFVALLSFIFIRETLSVFGYIGVLLCILGSLILSTRINKIDGKKTLYLIGIAIILITLYEFLIKIAVANISELNGTSLELIFIGLTICSFFLFNRRVRKLTLNEMKNLKLSLFSEFFTLIAIMATFFAMTYLPATTVSSIATIQPLAVLIFERTLFKFFGKIHKDKITFTRILSILLIILGVILLIFGGK